MKDDGIMVGLIGAILIALGFVYATDDFFNYFKFFIGCLICFSGSLIIWFGKRVYESEEE